MEHERAALIAARAQIIYGDPRAELPQHALGRTGGEAPEVLVARERLRIGHERLEIFARKSVGGRRRRQETENRSEDHRHRSGGGGRRHPHADRCLDRHGGVRMSVWRARGGMGIVKSIAPLAQARLPRRLGCAGAALTLGAIMPKAPIAEPAALSACLERWRAQPWIALDTEFVRVKTYFARLCLVQLHVPGEEPVCIDPLAVDIAPLIDFLREPQRTKVIHAARQDLEVLAQCGGDTPPPAPVFDTQIAAALCGFDPQTGYAELVAAATGVRLEKRHTRARWDRRPLSAEELHYAEDDVRYLGEVYAFLSERLAALGRTAWLEEECAALGDPALYRCDPERAYLRLKQGAQLSPAKQPVLKALAAWRERTARARDLPRHWVVPDAVLVAIAERLPADLSALRRIPGAGGALARRWGEEILAAVRAGRAQAPQRLWPEPLRLDSREQLLLARLTVRLEARAHTLGLAPSVLATRRDLVSLIRGTPDSAVLRGWRYETIGAELLALARGGAPQAAGLDGAQ